MKSFAPAAVDHFVFENFFRARRNGVFLDVGAGDGETGSNSLFFERFLGWRGLCTEPSAARFSRLVTQRKCHCEQVRIVGADAAVRDPANTSAAAPAADLCSLLQRHSLAKIDYCSIDAGGAEYEIVASLDRARSTIDVVTVHNAAADERVSAAMRTSGYESVAQLGGAAVFRHRQVQRLPRTSVLCAVWHLDEQRERLLQAHAGCLARQSVPVEPIYVFDGGDTPPPSLAGRRIVVHEDLTIYQAWNAGLSLVRTPFVMNLNLDDRLAPDAVERLEAALLRSGSALAAGDWRICYSQDETDRVEPCFPADRLPFVDGWPPRRGTVTRLGTDCRGTFGPATLWRLDAHIGAPRYPWQLPDGTLLRIAGDIGWWTLVTQLLKKATVRIPEIIGNYHSHPVTQAEFRRAPDHASDETELMKTLGISLL